MAALRGFWTSLYGQVGPPQGLVSTAGPIGASDFLVVSLLHQGTGSVSRLPTQRLAGSLRPAPIGFAAESRSC